MRGSKPRGAKYRHARPVQVTEELVTPKELEEDTYGAFEVGSPVSFTCKELSLDPTGGVEQEGSRMSGTTSWLLLFLHDFSHDDGRAGRRPDSRQFCGRWRPLK